MYRQTEVAFRILAAIAMKEGTITYKEFGIALGANHRNLGHLLNSVSDVCKERNTPNLAALVVMKGKGVPNPDGWAETDPALAYGSPDPKIEQKLCWEWGKAIADTKHQFCANCGKQLWLAGVNKNYVHASCES